MKETESTNYKNNRRTEQKAEINSIIQKFAAFRSHADADNTCEFFIQMCKMYILLDISKNRRYIHIICNKTESNEALKRSRKKERKKKSIEFATKYKAQKNGNKFVHIKDEAYKYKKAKANGGKKC